MIAYDIRDPKRLMRVHRKLAAIAAPIQYSVFTATLTKPELDRLLDQLGRLIDPTCDDVRAYRWPDRTLPSSGPVHRLPDGVWLINAPIRKRQN